MPPRGALASSQSRDTVQLFLSPKDHFTVIGHLHPTLDCHWGRDHENGISGSEIDLNLFHVVASENLDPTKIFSFWSSQALRVSTHLITQHQAESHIERRQSVLKQVSFLFCEALSEVKAEFSVSAHLPKLLRRRFPSRTPLQNRSTPVVAATLAMLLCAQVKTPTICKLLS